MSQEAFEVPVHDTMYLRVPGKIPNTVLTVEKMLYSWRLCEYSDPLFIARAWWYEELGEALQALSQFVATPGAVEAGGWLRADDTHEGQWRTRRARVEAGERVIVEDDGENDPWA
jgi:hypothetical protein